MKIKREEIVVDTLEGIHLYDITEQINQIVKESGIAEGFATINSMHTTTALTINEFESRLMDDVRWFLNKLIPPTDNYLHNDIHLRDCPDDEPENSHSHLASILLGNTESIIVSNGKLQFGKWQSVLFIELDGPRKRTVGVQVMGQ